MRNVTTWAFPIHSSWVLILIQSLRPRSDQLIEGFRLRLIFHRHILRILEMPKSPIRKIGRRSYLYRRRLKAGTHWSRKKAETSNRLAPHFHFRRLSSLRKGFRSNISKKVSSRTMLGVISYHSVVVDSSLTKGTRWIWMDNPGFWWFLMMIPDGSLVCRLERRVCLSADWNEPSLLWDLGHLHYEILVFPTGRFCGGCPHCHQVDLAGLASVHFVNSLFFFKIPTIEVLRMLFLSRYGSSGLLEQELPKTTHRSTSSWGQWR